MTARCLPYVPAERAALPLESRTGHDAVKPSRRSSPIKYCAGLLALIAVACALSTPTFATLIRPTVITDTPLLWEGYVIQTDLKEGRPVFFRPKPGGTHFINAVSQHWAIIVLEAAFSADGHINDISVDPLHKTAPHAGEHVNNALISGFLLDVLPGGKVVPGEFGNVGNRTDIGITEHPDGPHFDFSQVRYDPLTPKSSIISIRLSHGSEEPPALDAPFKAIDEPGTVILVALNLLLLWAYNKRR